MTEKESPSGDRQHKLDNFEFASQVCIQVFIEAMNREPTKEDHVWMMSIFKKFVEDESRSPVHDASDIIQDECQKKRRRETSQKKRPKSLYQSIVERLQAILKRKS